ncbi:MAG TPA: hypothetical protein VK509_01800, partial [Polyangiales bacterium]|nr:hypothetical protein [Polyangiales bacterium]
MSFEQLRRLGVELEHAWRAIDYDVDAFPALAGEQLAAAQLDAEVDFAEVVAQLLNPETALLQEPDFGFPDLPLVPYRGACFHLQLLVWASGSMAVHQHPFAGAFRVLAGSSVAATFSLDPVQRVSQQVRVVRARTEAVELLATGDCRPILPGAGLTHAVYHCGLPSVTLVARSHHVPWTADDQVLFRPSILLDARL